MKNTKLQGLFSPGRYYGPRLKIVHQMRLGDPLVPVRKATGTKDNL
jgi:hypothetical protein